jgi:phage tail sheath protein FI
MATYKRPGVYVEESLLPQQIEALGSATALGAFLSTSGRGPTTATLVTSWTDFVRKFGSFDSAYPLHFAVYQFFANGGNAAYVARVLGNGAVKATVTLTDRAGSPLSTLRVDAINEGAWANSTNATTGLSVEVRDNGTTDRFDLIVNQGGSGTPTGLNAVERFADLSMDVNDARYVLRQVNGVSQYITIANLSSATAAPANRPSASGVKTMASGADGSAPAISVYQNALTYGNVAAVFDTVVNSLVLNVPDTTTMTDSNAVLVLQAAGLYADTRGDVFVVGDVTATNVTAANAATFATSVMTGGSLNGSTIAMYWPYVVVADPVGAAGTTRTLPPGGAVVGLYLKTDVTDGVRKAPAGIGTGLVNVLATSVRLSATDLDSLNTATPPVNAIKPVPGAGVCVMGARTLRTQYVDRHVNVRRSLIYIKKSISELTQFAIFENNDERLWEQLRTTCQAFLNSFWQTGGLRGGTADDAFYVKCDSTNNTVQTIANGEVRVEVGVALQTPAEFVVIKIGQFDGGTTVSTDI